MRKELEDAIKIAVENMGEYFTSHNVIDFIRSRQHYKIFYDAEVADIVHQKKVDIRHAEHNLNTTIGGYLSDSYKTLNIEKRPPIGPLENIHKTKTEDVGYYRKKKLEFNKK